MTAYPTRGNQGHWWVTTWKGWNRLHAVPADAVDPDDEDALEGLRTEGLTTTARCGVHTRMAWPGLFSRLGCPRCAHCCRALGIPPGNGTPGNEEARNPDPAPPKGDTPTATRSTAQVDSQVSASQTPNPARPTNTPGDTP